MGQSQIVILINVTIGGIVAAFIYDLFRIKRRAVKTGVIIVGIEDFIYWIIAAIVLFLSIYVSNDGEIRSFEIIGFILGGILYFIILSRFIISIVIKMLKNIKKFLYGAHKIIAKPLNYIFKILRRLILVFCKKIKIYSGKINAINIIRKKN